jgi:hypothetical protein
VVRIFLNGYFVKKLWKLQKIQDGCIGFDIFAGIALFPLGNGREDRIEIPSHRPYPFGNFAPSSDVLNQERGKGVCS